MKTQRTFVSLTVIVLACTAFFWLTASSGVEKKVEVHTLPEYRSDTARAIDAQQQVMNRMLDSNERNMSAMQRQMNAIIRKLDKIQGDLDNLSQRISRIETKMGIENTPEENKQKPEQPQKKTPAIPQPK